jgi:hypothetical protein
MRGGRGNTGQTPNPISTRARGHFRIPTRFPPRRRHSHPRAVAGNRIFRRILFYRVGIQGLLARMSFRPVESEYRALYSRFTGQKNRGSVRHALNRARWRSWGSLSCADIRGNEWLVDRDNDTQATRRAAGGYGTSSSALMQGCVGGAERDDIVLISSDDE